MILPDWVLYVGLGCIAVIAYFLLGSFAFGAGYQPASRRVVERMLSLANVGPQDVLYDLGAGTGGIVFRAARERGAYAIGVEVDPFRNLFLRLRRWLRGPRDRVRILWGNLFEVDLTHATVIAVFLWPGAMLRLRPKMERELQPGTRVVSHWHEVPGWTPDVVDRDTRVYAYTWRGAPGPESDRPA
jgi:hypothetical protein